MTTDLQTLVANLTPDQLASGAGKALTRKLLRTQLGAWCRYVLKPKGEVPAKHHELIIATLQKVTMGQLKKVILLMPPGSAKSTYTSVCFPPWYLCNHPRNLILACSYSYTLIEGFGRQCRDIIKQHSEVLGISLSDSASAAGDWRLAKTDGGYFCAGVGSGIAGHRADLAFIDDFLGNEEDTNSSETRKKQYAWYRNDFLPRLKPDAAVVIIANRRHEEDLVGRLTREDGDWIVISLPMEATGNDPLGRKPGELLWPEWFGMNEKAKANVQSIKKNPRTWNGLYQQNPIPDEGNYFPSKDILTYGPNELPSNLRIYVGSDYAVRRGEDNDRFCFMPAGIDDQGRLWILPDLWWTCSDTLTATDQQLEMAKRRSPICWWAGKENITGSIAPFLYERMRERNIYIPIEEFSESRDKEQKAQPIKARMSAKTVLFPNFAPWWPDALSELLAFPNGTHDDFVDALAKLGQGLSKMTRPSKPTTQEDWANRLNKPLTCRDVIRSHNRETRRRGLVSVYE